MRTFIKDCVSDFGDFIGRNKFAIGGIGAMILSGYICKKARDNVGEIVTAKEDFLITNVDNAFKEMMSELKEANTERLTLKRELTNDEINEIEKRIFFKGENLKEILTDMDLVM